MVVDRTRRFIGAVRLADLLGQPREQLISAISVEVPAAQASEPGIEAAAQGCRTPPGLDAGA
ncbi:hypothetical protein AAHB37_14445 [Glutamicibacter halophytocola]|uniref:hypothetical protein n=1 Tax=Glutamicibacter halophytocola TaxID=1933880 RepID=UPI00321BA420